LTGVAIQKLGTGRKYLRTEIKLAIQIIGTDLSPINILTEDISGGGLKVISKQFLEIGTQLNCTISNSKLGIIKANGEVVRTEKKDQDYRLGINFTEISKRDRNKLIDFTYRMGEHATINTTESNARLTALHWKTLIKDT